MCLQAVARQVVDSFAGEAGTPFRVELVFLALVRQDQFARRVQAAIPAWLGRHPKTLPNAVRQVSFHGIDGLRMRHVDAALQTITFRVPAGGRRHAEKVANLAGFERRSLGHVVL